MPRRDADAPRLVWPGKGASPRVSAPPLVVTERWGRGGNRLVAGDNLRAAAALRDELAGKVDLIYVDPPFLAGTDFLYRGLVGESEVLESEAYRDTWSSPAAYLDMLWPRLELFHELLSPTGSLYLHMDPTIGHYVKVLLDEVFGPGCFQREIVWRIGWLSGFKTRAKNWIRNHDCLYYYTKDPDRFTFNKSYTPYPEGYRRRDGALPTGKGAPLEDVWNAGPDATLEGADSLDSIQIKSFSREKTGYDTQKNESVLRRIIEASSNPGDLVADFFCGSGTTLAVAEKLGRRWIGCDSGRFAIHTTRRRLLGLGAAFDVESFDSPADQGAIDARLDGEREVTLTLTGYEPRRSHPAIKSWSDAIDEWAVDWEFDGQTFRAESAHFRTRNERGLDLSETHAYRRRGRRTVLLRVVDVFGVETRRAFTRG